MGNSSGGVWTVAWMDRFQSQPGPALGLILVLLQPQPDYSEWGAESMQWYSHLYVGDKAKKDRYRIIQGIRYGRLQPEVYVITPPGNGKNILDIYPSAMLLLPPCRDEDFLVIGIAVTYWEALEVARRIVDDLYQRTGEFSLDSLIGDMG